MTENNFDRFEILRRLAVASSRGLDINLAVKEALELSAKYVGFQAAAVYLWDDNFDINVTVTYSEGDAYQSRLSKLESDLFLKLRKDKKLLSAYMTFDGSPPLHSFTQPLRCGKDIFGAVIGLQQSEKPIVVENLFLESLSALVALSFAAYDKKDGLSREQIEKERFGAVMDTAVTVNHEVNNPLTAILGNVQLLLMNQDDLSEELKNKLKTIEESALKIRDVTQRLMRLTSSKTTEYNGGTRMVDIYDDDDEKKDDE